MRTRLLGISLWLSASYVLADPVPLGLPPPPIPDNNLQTPEKIALGNKLFHDQRFSSTGKVSCATCHIDAKAFTDSPLTVSEGINKLQGTRNAPTAANSAYMASLFWDGRSPTLEDQAKNPIVNPVEMGLPDHGPVLQIVRTDPEYAAMFNKVFAKAKDDITIDHVVQAISSYERTLVYGNSPFDRYYFGGDKQAMSPAAVRGLEVFRVQGRCVSCHVIEQTQALFTDNRFHNIGVGINRIQAEVPNLTAGFLKARAEGTNVDKAVLTDKKASELGRFAVQTDVDKLGAFKTPTLRNVAVTAPYMHDGSLKDLRAVIDHYNNGGTTDPKLTPNPFLSGGIRPLKLSEEQINDLVAFLEALTSPEFTAPTKQAARSTLLSCDQGMGCAAEMDETSGPGARLNSFAGPQGEGQDARSKAECTWVVHEHFEAVSNKADRPSTQLNNVERISWERCHDI